MSIRFHTLYLLFFLSLHLQAQDLLPFVENYSKSDYQGDNQIWNVAQGKDKAMYFANNHYFLRYDGVQWEKYTLPYKTIIRSILIDGEKIYSGSYKEFGYWIRRGGKMEYISLSAGKAVFDDKANEEIWKIFKYKGAVYFQSFNEIFVYSDNKIRKIKLPFQISYGFEVGGELLLASITQGVFKLEGTTFKPLEQNDYLKNTIIHHIEKSNGKTYYFTQKNGVFITGDNGLAAWNHPLNSTLKTSIVNVAKFIDDNQLVIGTASSGVFIVDMNNGAVTAINRSNVMKNNSVLSIGTDSENDLWLGLDNGIAHIEVNSPISIFSDNSGNLGSVYSVAPTPDGSYLMASNHGLFKYDRKLELIPNSQGQAWDISKLGSTFLIGHNEGTFTYSNNTFSRLNSIHGGWTINKSGINDTYLQSTYCGVVIYLDKNDLSKTKEIKGLCKPIKYAAQNKKNEIWAADNYRGLYRVAYDDNYETLRVDNITQQNKIENDFGIKIFEFRDEVLFLIDREWYTYNSIAGQLEKNPLFNANFTGISDIEAIDENKFIVLRDGLLYVVAASGNRFVQTLLQEKYYSGKIINDHIKISRHENKYLLNLDDGFIAIASQHQRQEVPAIKLEAYYQNEPFASNSKIKYNTGLRINVISGYYGTAKPNLFYKFNDSKKFLPVKNGYVVLNNLDSGKQHIEVYHYDGTNYTKVATFNFSVAQPWYFSFWMIAGYIILIALLSYLYYKWNKIKYHQKLALREEELKHQKKILELKLKAENELNLKQYEKHILELEVQTKSSEVAGKSLSIAKQGEIIDSIEQILDRETDVDKIKSEIRKAVKINAVNKHEWEIFESNLSQIHNEFIVRLTKKHPNLTSRDIKLCIYLKMNLSSKEMAPLMNISFRGVELQRYRLRKKLGLQAEESLYKFMTSL